MCGAQGGRPVRRLTADELAELAAYNARLQVRFGSRPAPEYGPETTFWRVVAEGDPKQFTRAHRQRMRALQDRHDQWRLAVLVAAQYGPGGAHVTRFEDGSALIIPREMVYVTPAEGDGDALDAVLAMMVDSTPSRPAEH